MPRLSMLMGCMTGASGDLLLLLLFLRREARLRTGRRCLGLISFWLEMTVGSCLVGG